MSRAILLMSLLCLIAAELVLKKGSQAKLFVTLLLAVVLMLTSIVIVATWGASV